VPIIWRELRNRLTGPDALHAQSYPARSVTLVVPSAAGGGTDTIARLIGDQLAKQLSQGFVVENRTGAGMLVGTTAVAKAVPDGYTLLVGLNGNMAVNPSLFAKLPYDPLADFTYITGPSIKFFVDNEEWDHAAWVCESSCFANNPQQQIGSGLGEIEPTRSVLQFCNSRCEAAHCDASAIMKSVQFVPWDL
jgi:Tripartite tricarboxylate transporter family receptor